ncbi:MAG TPA: CHAP domain-containing protein [Solirubrobacteraceae bacterium]|jgi:surface antigen|nr:CHAP domain-containing protein [Solirubrobacteraceae bacterium]
MKTELQAFLEQSVAAVSRRTAVLFTVLAAVLLGLGLCSAAAARADGLELCAGYAGCTATGFSTHDYEYAADESWWSMYAGDNCTNYAAYVESQAYGVPTPGIELGDADQWGVRAAEAGIPVDATPTVGAVAVWGADAPGMGGYGHVAVVEAVAPDGSYIDVSQSGMGTSDDGYDWEQIDRDGSSWEPWPGSFIHFAGPAIPGTLPQAGLRIAGAGIAVSGGG